MKANEADVIVVGGGLAGLTAAAVLARVGRRVEVFESGELGGRAATVDRSGFLFNEGPHALYAAGAGREVLDQLGVSYTGGAPPPEGAHGLVGGRLHELPRSLASLVTTGALSVGAKVEAGSVLTRLQALSSEGLHHTSISQWLAENVRSEEVANLIRGLFRLSTYAHDSDRASFGSALEQFQLGLKTGVLYLDGGWQTLTDGLRSRAEEHGATIHAPCRVKSVAQHAAGFRVQIDDGDAIDAQAVVLAVRPAVAAALAPASEALSAWSQQAIPVRAACLDLGLERLPDPKRPFVLGLDEPLYLSVHTRSARLAPEGGATIHVARYLGSEPPADAAATERELEELMDLAQPGWRDALRERRYLPNMVVSNWLPAAASGGNAGRPGPEVPDVHGLYVAGDWVGPTGMLADTALASGKAAAEALLRSPARAPEYALA